jgi:hypothetical protein
MKCWLDNCTINIICFGQSHVNVSFKTSNDKLIISFNSYSRNSKQQQTNKKRWNAKCAGYMYKQTFMKVKT